MSVIDILRDEYPSDEAWKQYAAVFWPSAPVEVQDEMRALVPEDEELAMVLVGVLGYPESAHWLTKKLDALDGSSPREIIESESRGTTIVRSALMRMPV